MKSEIPKPRKNFAQFLLDSPLRGNQIQAQLLINIQSPRMPLAPYTSVNFCLRLRRAPCELIEQIPGKVSDRPVVRGTRIMQDSIVNSYDLGDSVGEIHEGFPTRSVIEIERLIEPALLHRHDAPQSKAFRSPL